jgi:hypothetical protein
MDLQYVLCSAVIGTRTHTRHAAGRTSPLSRSLILEISKLKSSPSQTKTFVLTGLDGHRQEECVEILAHRIDDPHTLSLPLSAADVRQDQCQFPAPRMNRMNYFPYFTSYSIAVGARMRQSPCG